MTEFINILKIEFEKNGDRAIAREQKAYLRNQFDFFGLKTPVRGSIQKPFFVKEFLPEKSGLHTIVRTLWDWPQREYQYFAQEFALKYAKKFEKKDLALFEFMVTRKSWWDTVDFIATKLIGEYFRLYPEGKNRWVEKSVASNNSWLQRSALLFQLKYKHNTDTGLLAATIFPLLGTKEFFIDKAIGWILREYSRTNPEWVLKFVSDYELSTLSQREALRLMK